MRGPTVLALLVVLAMLAAPGCSGGGDGAAGAAEDPPGESPDPAVGTDGVAEAASADEPVPDEPVPDLAVERVAELGAGWTNPRVAEGAMFVYRVVDDATSEVGRVDPGTGRLVARRAMTSLAAWQPTTQGVVVLHTSRRELTILDPVTLEVRRQIALPEDYRISIPQSCCADPYWVGVQRYDADRLAGVETAMAAAELDLAAGDLVRAVDVPACGANAAVQLGPDSLLVGIKCRYHLGLLDPATGEIRTRPSFAASVTMFPVEGDVWLRWSVLGTIARWNDGELVTLDLNSAAATLSDLGRILPADGSVWVTGRTLDEGDRLLLMRIDPGTVEVVARAWSPSHVAFLGGDGYAIDDGWLVRFDPGTVTTGAPVGVARPEPRTPPAAEPATDDERAAVDTFATVWDTTVPDEVVEASIEPAAGILEVRRGLIAVAAEYEDLEVRVTSVDVVGDRASLAYVFLLDGEIAMVPLTARLDRVDGRWVVAKDSICQLANQAGVSDC